MNTALDGRIHKLSRLQTHNFNEVYSATFAEDLIVASNVLLVQVFPVHSHCLDLTLAPNETNPLVLKKSSTKPSALLIYYKVS